jgi:glycosyltransferase involved in cell wall biosynthesis
MVIAVNTRYLLKGRLEGCGYFIQETFRQLTKQFPQHRFYFLFDRPFDPEFIFSENIEALVLNPPARHPILWKYWYDVQVARTLKKIKADVFVSADGFCSLTTRVPQCLVIHDLAFLHHPESFKPSHMRFLKRYTPRFLKKAAFIATVSDFSKKDLIKQYGTDPDKIMPVFNGVKEIFRPIAPEEREATRQEYTEGREYFIYAGALQPRKNLVNLLKAFSIFKKRQQSNMKLVLAGRLAWKNEAFLESLKTYKYRDDVVMTGYVEEELLARLIGSAYALVYPSFFEGFGVPVLEAMRAGTAVLTSAESSMQEIAGESALYFDPASHQSIADQMMLVYKDESLRAELIQKAREESAPYSWERTSELLWQCIEKAAKPGKSRFSLP